MRSAVAEIQKASAGGAPDQASLVARMRISEKFDRSWLRPAAESAGEGEPSELRRDRHAVSLVEVPMGESR